MIKRIIRRVSFLVLFSILILVGGISTYVLAGGVSTATNSIKINFLNSSGSNSSGSVISFNLSTQSLVDLGILESDAFNSEIHEGTTDIVYMPGTLQVQLEAAFNNSSGDETSDANNNTINDVVLPSANSEVIEFGLHNSATILHINTGTVTDASWTVTWEYYNGATWKAFSVVSDGTIGFTVAGVQKVSWTKPTDWIDSTLHSVKSYWVRARVSGFTSLTISPLATQVWYETGEWWVFVPSLENGVTVSYDVYVGGGTDFQSFHNYFPGAGGITVSDSSSLEMGNNWDIDINGFFDMSTPVTGGGLSKNIVNKEGALRIYINTANQITISITGSGITSFFSESTDASLSNHASTYKVARDRLNGDEFTSSATGSRIGQAFNTVTSSQIIGTKLDDPS